MPLSATAAYGAKQLLHFSSEQLSGTSGSIAVTNQDAVQVVAYLGDVIGAGGPLELADASTIALISQGIASATNQTLPGFAAYPNLDPVIVGDVSNAGAVNLTDAAVMNQEIGGTAKTAIPYAPQGLSVTPTGPDPALSVPAVQQAPIGETVVVPVNIDTGRPTQSRGMTDAVLALTYDPKVFSVISSDVSIGTLPEEGTGWQMQVSVNQRTGQIGIELYSNTPIQSMAGGSLVTIAMQVIGTPPAGAAPITIVPFVDPTGGMRVYDTQVSDAQGAYVLHYGTGSPEAGASTWQGAAGSEQLGAESGQTTTDSGPAVKGAERVGSTDIVFADMEQNSSNQPLAEYPSATGAYSSLPITTPDNLWAYLGQAEESNGLAFATEQPGGELFDQDQADPAAVDVTIAAEAVDGRVSRFKSG